MHIKEYQIGPKIYEDVIGSLHIANPSDSDKAVYFKLLHERYSKQDELVQEFHEGAEFYCSIEHDKQIQAREHGQENGKHYIILDYFNLIPLEKKLHKNHVLPLIDAFTLIETIAKVIRTYHIDGIVHGNLTPQNIFVDNNLTEVSIADFGFQDFIRLLSQRNHSEMANMLPYYAPETIEKSEIDRRSDIYSLGMLLYKMLLGETPNYLDELITDTKQSETLTIIPPSLQRLEIPDYIDTIIYECLDPKIENRYQNTSQLINRITEAKESLLASITPITSQLIQKEKAIESEVPEPFELLDSEPLAGQNNTQSVLERSEDDMDRELEKPPELEVAVPPEKDKELPEYLNSTDTISTESAHANQDLDELFSIPQSESVPNTDSVSDEKEDLAFLSAEKIKENELEPLTSTVNVQNNKDQFSLNENDLVVQKDPAFDLHSEPEEELKAVTEASSLPQKEMPDESNQESERDLQVTGSEDGVTNDKAALQQKGSIDASSNQHPETAVQPSLMNDLEFRPQESEGGETQLPSLDLDDLETETTDISRKVEETQPVGDSVEPNDTNLPTNDFQNAGDSTVLDNGEDSSGYMSEFWDETATQTAEIATTQTLNLYNVPLHRRSLKSISKFFIFAIVPLCFVFLFTSFVFDVNWNAQFAKLRQSAIFNKLEPNRNAANEQNMAVISNNEDNPATTSTNNSQPQDEKTNTQMTMPQNSNLANPITESEGKNNIGRNQDKLKVNNTAQARSLLSTQVTLSLTVNSDKVPQISDVYLNGKYLGQSNGNGQFTISDLAVNRSYLIKVQKSGFEMWAKEIMFSRSGQIKLNVALRPTTDNNHRKTYNPASNLSSSTVNVELSNSQNINYAFIYINGKLWDGADNLAPAKISLSPGRYLLEVKKEGYRSEPSSLNLDLADNENKTVYFQLTRK